MLLAKDLYKSYDQRPVLQGVSLSLAKGEFLSIMGESGSGKSTLLAVLAGNAAPDSGEVWLDGERITGMDEASLAKLRRTKLGFVYQELNLIDTLNGEENMLLPIVLARGDRKKAKEELLPLAERLGIAKLFSRYPREMSGGERQRVAIARAMLHTPACLMLDEPTGSLDSRSAEEVLSLLLKMKEEMGVSIVQVTHSARAASLSDRVIRIADGQVVS